MSVPVANGESSASGSQHPSHAATSSSTPALSAFPPETVQRLPRSQFMAIEYPGILRKDGRKKEKKDEDVMDVDSGEEEEEEEEEEDLDVSPLGRALSSLSPVPPPHNHPGTALDHISDVLHQNTRLLEYSLDIYKHPIIGDILPTNDILCKITKRVWRRVRPPGTASGDGGEPECVKEYHVELLGPISNTVRFRRMADFAFKPEFAPDVPGTQPDNAQVIRSSSSGGNTSITPPTTAEAPNPATVSSGKSDDSGTVNLGGSVSIHQLQSQLRRMDFDAISKFRFAEPNSRYEETVQGPDGEPVKRSTAFLVPPPIFSRQEVPWPYHYKHSTGSMLITYPKGEGQFERRYMNVQHYRGLGPTGVVLAALKDGPIPQGPDRVHQRQLIYVDQEILAKMKKLFEERPIWSKIALMNQFAAEDQLNLSNAKFYLPQVSFIIYDSCFRDCNVRYGYDVRKEPGSRLHQRVQFHFRNNARSNRRPTAMLQRADTSMPMTGDEDAAAAAAAAAPSSPPPADEDGEEQEDGGEDEDEVVAAEGEEEGEEEEEGNVPGRPTTGTKQDAAGRKRSHIFDGTTAANIGVQINYTLMDITDPMLQDYINVQGAINIRSSFDIRA
ncbi:unnamed protein product [Tilletia controversa]|nr:unnamed protein product [Tilletia controversa]